MKIKLCKQGKRLKREVWLIPNYYTHVWRHTCELHMGHTDYRVGWLGYNLNIRNFTSF